MQNHAGYYRNLNTKELKHCWVEAEGEKVHIKPFEEPITVGYRNEKEFLLNWEKVPSYSFSTFRLLHECPHNYVNKISGIKQPESPALVEGKQCHRIMQDHVAGIKKHPDLEHINFEFPVVEEKDFDDRLKFTVEYNGIVIFGYIDGLDKLIPDKPEIMLEGKFSSSPWSNSKYKKDPQRKIYGWAVKSLKQALLITGVRDPGKWETIKPKTTIIRFTDQDYEDAEKYINFALDVIRSGDFTTDLVDGKCTDPRCWWGERCMFK